MPLSGSTRDNTKGKRPEQTGQLIGVRLQPVDLNALDRWISEQPEELTRPEAIRRILRANLPID
jgi:hypothetical protein